MGYLRCSWSQVSAFSSMTSHWYRMPVAVKWLRIVRGFMSPGSLTILDQMTRYGNPFAICIFPCTGSMVNINHERFYLMRWCMVSNPGPLNLVTHNGVQLICSLYMVLYHKFLSVYRLCDNRYVMDIHFFSVFCISFTLIFMQRFILISIETNN